LTGNQKLKNELRITLEVASRVSEQHRFQESVDRLRQEGYTVRGFYHTSAWQKHWRHVVEEQLRLMGGQRVNIMKFADYDTQQDDDIPWDRDSWDISLLGVIDRLTLTMTSSTLNDFRDMKELVDTLDISQKDKIHFQFNISVPRLGTMNFNTKQKKKFYSSTSASALSDGEFSSILSLHEYCVDQERLNKKSIVFYVHNKGSCCVRSTGSLPVTHWREIMNTYTLEYPSICLRATMEGYSTCGVNMQIDPKVCYSGNFWWARCDHIAMLPRPSDRFNCIDPEFFLFNVSSNIHHKRTYATQCGYNAFECHVNHYSQPCPRGKYVPDVFDSVIESKLSPSTLGGRILSMTGNSTMADALGMCSNWRRRKHLDYDLT
jgi:hypothetical protein